jgi:hypothetical protein
MEQKIRPTPIKEMPEKILSLGGHIYAEILEFMSYKFACAGIIEWKQSLTFHESIPKSSNAPDRVYCHCSHIIDNKAGIGSTFSYNLMSAFWLSRTRTASKKKTQTDNHQT